MALYHDLLEQHSPELDANSSAQLADTIALMQQQQLHQLEPVPADQSVQTVNDGQLESIVNVTREFPLSYAKVMFGYLLPVVLLMTIVTNLLVVAVLYQRHMRTPTNIVLFAMAIVDLFTLLSPSPWYLYIYAFGNHDKFLYPPSFCYAHHVMTDVVPVFFHTSSIWLALLLASQRYIYVCHPVLARTWCTVPRVKRAIMCIMGLAFCHQVSRLFDNVFLSVKVEINNVQHMACKNEIAQWVQALNVNIYYMTYFTFRILFVFIIPCSALITLNWLLFRALKQAETRRTELLKTRYRIVSVDPSQVERPSQHNLQSFGALANSGSREPPSYAPSFANFESGCVTVGGGGRGSDAKRHLMHEEETNRSALVEDEGGGGGGGGGNDCEGIEIKQDRKLSRLIELANDSHQTAARESRGEDTSHQPNQGRKSSREDANEALQQTPAAHQRANQLPSTKDPADSARADYAARGISLRSGSSASSSTNTASITTKTDDLSTCAECAAYETEMRRVCRHCSLAPEADQETRAACEHIRASYHKHLQHQPISQCSSILGGATNTTTNEEDISSCMATQNITQSSMFPTNAIEGIETSSMRGADDDEVGPDDELSVGCLADARDGAASREASLDIARLERARVELLRLARAEADPELGPMIKSGSIDSRLTCGCLSTRAMALRRARSLGKPKQESAFARNRLTMSCREGHSCSSSRKPSTVRASIQKGEAGSHPQSDQPHLLNGRDEAFKGTNSAEASRLEESSPTGAGGRGAGERCNRVDFQPAAGQPATTTTTLYSANTSSAGSLGAVGSSKPPTEDRSAPSDNQLSEKTTKTRSDYQLTASGATGHAGGPSSAQRTKSPSFASCSFVRSSCNFGRGSGATLLNAGSGGVPTSLVASQSGTPQNTFQAAMPSTRSLDSNRTTLMLVVVVTVFLFVEVPVALVTISHVLLNSLEFFKDIEFGQFMNHIKLFTNFMIMISYSVNFTIYCSMSKRFRETFRDLFYCGRSSARARTKRIFSQSQAAHCTQINPHNFAAPSTVVTTALHPHGAAPNSNIGTTNNSNNNSNNNNNSTRNSNALRLSRQLGDSGVVASKQDLLGGQVPRRSGQQSECEL